MQLSHVERRRWVGDISRINQEINEISESDGR